jgi:hypothetical protein
MRNFGMANNIPDLLYKIHYWVVNNIDYIDDQFDETIISPRIMTSILKGDCDDMSLFIKSCISCFNVPSKYLLLGKKFGNFSHIANGKLFPEGWIYVDGTSKYFNLFPRQRYIFYQVI